MLLCYIISLLITRICIIMYVQIIQHIIFYYIGVRSKDPIERTVAFQKPALIMLDQHKEGCNGSSSLRIFLHQRSYVGVLNMSLSPN